MYFVTLYGVLTFVLMKNPIQELVLSAFGRNTMLDTYYFGDRIRINSTWSHPIAYGLICGALFYEYLPYWKKRTVGILMSLLAFNVFVCGSRTALAAFFLMGGVIVLTRYKMSRALKQSFLVLLLAFPVYLAVPMVHDKVDSMINTAMGNEDVDGSSLEMRDEQTYYAMLIVNESPVLGHGLDYIQEVMGYGTENYKGDWHLLGFESYSYTLLIERGVMGFFLEIFMWIALVVSAFKCRKKDVANSSLIIAFVWGFAFFSMSTGTLDTKIPMMFMIGMALTKMSKNNNVCFNARK